MLRRAGDLIGLTIVASDGEVGALSDLLFDDERWTIRWAVVDAGSWLTGHSVLLAPRALEVAPEADRLTVDLTRTQVESGPLVSADQPVSRQMQARIYDHYGWTPYWSMYGDLTVPSPLMAPDAYMPAAVPDGTAADAGEPGPAADPHLRSMAEVTGYHINARDGEIGRIKDFLVEKPGWAIRYLLIDTGTWWPGRQVLISKGWVSALSWSQQAVALDLTRNEIRSSPAYDPARLDRAYEESLHGHYGRPGYWAG